MMVCPFRVGVSFSYKFIGRSATADEYNPELYLDKHQKSVFEECLYNDCPFFEYVMSATKEGYCKRVDYEE